MALGAALYLVEGEGLEKKRRLAALSENFTRQGYRVKLILLRNQRASSSPGVKCGSRREPHLAAERLLAAALHGFVGSRCHRGRGARYEQEMGRAVMNLLTESRQKNYFRDLIVTQRSVVK